MVYRVFSQMVFPSSPHNKAYQLAVQYNPATGGSFGFDATLRGVNCAASRSTLFPLLSAIGLAMLGGRGVLNLGATKPA